MAAEETRLSGQVERERVSPGSKSDRVAVVLRTDDGSRYVLRRMGGNPFRDEVLEGLVGKSIAGTGFLTGTTFILNDWAETGGA
jgi:hypothetical protein